MNDALVAIENSLSQTKSRIKERYEYALYLSIELPYLCRRLLQVLLVTHVRDSLLKHVLIKITQGELLADSFVQELFSRFQNGDKHVRRSAATVLIRLIEHIPSQVAVELFNLLINSQSKLDRNRASQIAEFIFNNEIEQKLWDSWHCCHDNALLRVLAKKTTLESLRVRFAEIWHTESIPFRFKNEALKRLAAFDFNAVSFVENDKPVSYLTACVAANITVRDDFIEKLVKNAQSIRELGYVIWCTGKLRKTQLLLKLIDNAEALEINIPKDLDEILFDQFILNEYPPQK